MNIAVKLEYVLIDTVRYVAFRAEADWGINLKLSEFAYDKWKGLDLSKPNIRYWYNVAKGDAIRSVDCVEGAAGKLRELAINNNVIILVDSREDKALDAELLQDVIKWLYSNDIPFNSVVLTKPKSDYRVKICRELGVHLLITENMDDALLARASSVNAINVFVPELHYNKSINLDTLYLNIQKFRSWKEIPGGI